VAEFGLAVLREDLHPLSGLRAADRSVGELDLIWGYRHLPIALQNAACWIDAKRKSRLRFNAEFDRILEWLQVTDFWSAGEIEAYQDEQLRLLVAHAYENVPYYRSRMDEERLTPSDIRTRSDLPKLPILTKEELRANMDRLVARNARRWQLVRQHTSGTTGTRLDFLVSRRAVAFQWTVWWRHHLRFGVDPRCWRVNFMATPVVPPGQDRPPYWRWQSPLNQAIVNVHHATPGKIGDIVDFLDSERFEAHTGRASATHAVAAAALEAGLQLKHPPRATFVGSEGLFSAQRRDIERFTGSIVSTHYGFNEGCGNASHCPELVYHEDPEFGILEVVETAPDRDGRVRGELVCTGFASPEAPLIRYRVGDIGVLEGPAWSCACGRASRVLTSIEGRSVDYVLTPEGRRIFQFDTFYGEIGGVREFQVVQKTPGSITVRIVRRPDYQMRNEEAFVTATHRWASPELAVEFEYVSEIEREPSGKFIQVKSTRA
jgi:phenylacetate-CoA ligase